MHASQIATILGRSRHSIHDMKNKLGLSGKVNSGKYTINQLSQIMQVTRETIYWWKNRCGLKMQKTVIEAISSTGTYLIKQENLMKWLKDNQDRYDATKIEFMALGIEPDWLREKRRIDLRNTSKNGKLWTKTDVSRMLLYYQNGKSFKQIGELLGRTPKSVEAKLARLYKK